MIYTSQIRWIGYEDMKKMSIMKKRTSIFIIVLVMIMLTTMIVPVTAVLQQIAYRGQVISVNQSGGTVTISAGYQYRVQLLGHYTGLYLGTGQCFQPHRDCSRSHGSQSFQRRRPGSGYKHRWTGRDMDRDCKNFPDSRDRKLACNRYHR